MRAVLCAWYLAQVIAWYRRSPVCGGPRLPAKTRVRAQPVLHRPRPDTFGQPLGYGGTAGRWGFNVLEPSLLQGFGQTPTRMALGLRQRWPAAGQTWPWSKFGL